MPSLKSSLCFVLVIASAGVMAGCGFSCSVGGDTISSEELSSQVKSSLEKEVGAPLASVDCPDVKAEVGETYSCDGTTPNGDEIKIDGEVTEFDSETGEFKTSFEVVSPAAA